MNTTNHQRHSALSCGIWPGNQAKSKATEGSTSSSTSHVIQPSMMGTLEQARFRNGYGMTFWLRKKR